MPVVPWLALPLAMLGTWLAIGYARRRNLVDLPGERRSHQVVTPRGGGVAIVAVVLAALPVLAVAVPSLRADLALFGSGLALVAGIGWWDDHRPLSAGLRLLVHMLAGVLLAVVAWRQGGGGLAITLAFVFAVSLVNVWNFMDGINGLASSQAAIVCVAFALLLPPAWAVLAWLVAAACGGFLPFNFPRARIFLGDVGSGALGYMVAALLMLTAVLTPVHWALLALPIVAFVGDAGLTLARRVLTGQRWTQPHTQHLYQRVVKRGASHTLVTLAYAGFTILAAMVMHHSASAGLSGAVSWMSFLLAAAVVGACWRCCAWEWTR